MKRKYTAPHKVHRTKIIPLRWFANFCGWLGMKILKPYLVWGTTYALDLDEFLANSAFDDYDEDGIPYWEKWENERP